MRLAAAAFATTLAGCAALPPPAPLPPFDSAAHRQYIGPGTSSITGQAFLRQKGGGVVTCAGATVYLFPATPYFEAAIKSVRARERSISQISPDPALLRTTMCNAQGGFAFAGVPDGSWYVATRVAWTVGTYSHQGGNLAAKVTLRPGQGFGLILSEENLYGW